MAETKKCKKMVSTDTIGKKARCEMPEHTAQYSSTDQLCTGHQWAKYGSIKKGA